MFHASAVFAAGFGATPAGSIRVPEGFRVELLYTVPKDEQGSWVNMTPDPQGRLIVSDQYGSLYRVTPGSDADSTQVERLSVDIGQAQGLLCAFDSLYVVVNGDAAQGAGLYRLRDTDGDDQYDDVKLLRKFEGGGEHGPHAVVLGPDGKSLYVCAGNHTELPAPEKSLVPRHWQEDQLLPRMWDAGGHAVGRLAPGGWICRTDPEGNEFELVSSGFRNEYDIAFNTDGELFTYDADMEWDIGSPWYRPTRVLHVTSGAEFGWRSGTGKWPAYYEDSLPAAVNIGPGSPTGIVFGTAAKFPAQYQRALFMADWSFGLIYVVHLETKGSTYTGTFEKFASAAPLPVTDIVVNPTDGAMYFTIGGRRTQSALYRVTYKGDESTEPFADDANSPNIRVRAMRHILERAHAADAPADIDRAWRNLDNADRFMRYAARIALEHQPVDRWKDRALAETNPRALIAAMIALARCGDGSLQEPVVDALGRLDWSSLTGYEKLALLRAYALAFIRLGEPGDQVRSEVIRRIDKHYPADNQPLNRELSQLLIYLEAPGVVERTLALLAKAPTQEEQIHYVLSLRVLQSGWTLDQRREYFEWFNKTGAFRGGHSFAGFLHNIREEAIRQLSEEERKALEPVLNEPPPAGEADEPLESRPFVKKWTVDDLLPGIEDELTGRDFRRGRELFAAASCFKCHRFDGEGGIIGPDLTGVSGRFNVPDLLESLIEPSKVVSDQYQASVFYLIDGKTVIGKVANLSGDRLMVITNMLEPGNFTDVDVNEIEEQVPSRTSMMPDGLLDTLTRDEILDLIAYLRSGGNPDDVAFKSSASE